MRCVRERSSFGSGIRRRLIRTAERSVSRDSDDLEEEYRIVGPRAVEVYDETGSGHVGATAKLPSPEIAQPVPPVGEPAEGERGDRELAVRSRERVSMPKVDRDDY